MTPRLVIAFIACGMSVLCSLLIYVNHRRSRTPLPRYEVGAIAGSIGLPLLVTGTSTLFDDGVRMVLLILGALLCVMSGVVVFLARRQMRSSGR